MCLKPDWEDGSRNQKSIWYWIGHFWPIKQHHAATFELGLGLDMHVHIHMCTHIHRDRCPCYCNLGTSTVLASTLQQRPHVFSGDHPTGQSRVNAGHRRCHPLPSPFTLLPSQTFRSWNNLVSKQKDDLQKHRYFKQLKVFGKNIILFKEKYSLG